MDKPKKEIAPLTKEDTLPESHLSVKQKSFKKLLKHSKKPLIYGLGVILFLILASPILTYAYFVRDLSSKESIISKKNAGVILTDRFDKPFFTFYEARTKKTATLEQIPINVQNAVIASEDKDFYKHPGFSLRGIARAFVVNIQQEGISQGGSTISQQLIKNTLLNQNRSFLRKYQEFILALELERRYSKNDILEMYLNTVYFGEGAFGIEDASSTYFNKTSSKLTLSESALLVGILPAPSAFSPITGDKTKAFNRRDIVLNEMKKGRYITDAEEKQAKNDEIKFNPTYDDLNQIAPHFALMVKEELIEKYSEQSVAQSGYTVKTTLDLTFQEYAETVVKNQVTRLKGSEVTNGSVVAIDPKTGEIITLVGSWDWSNETNGKINMAIRPRQPGSSFKPLVYAKAFEERILTPGSIIEDKETIYPGGYKPKNYDGRFRGNVTVRTALANSLNIPAVKALDLIGVSSGLEIAKRFGVTTLDKDSDYGLSLALGSGEISLLQMTSAFSVFANNGEYNKPISILEIKDKKGNIIHTQKNEPRNIIDRDITFLISSILSDNNARSEVFGGLLTISRPAAVKTGTTEDYRDSLTIGYTPSITVGAWVGNNDNSPMDRIAGSTGAAPIWRLIIERILQGTTRESFIPPSGVTQLTICKENGLKTTVATSSAYPEYFLKGTEPTKDCGISEIPTPSASPTPEPTELPKPSETPNPTPTDIQPTDTLVPTDNLIPTIPLP